MQKSSFLLFLALILGSTLTQFPFDRGTKLPTYPVYSNDIVEYDLTQVYQTLGENIDWSKVTFKASQQIPGQQPVDLDAQIGQAFTKPYLNLDQGFPAASKINRVIRLTERKFVVIADFSKIYYYHTTNNGLDISPYTKKGTYEWMADLSTQVPVSYSCEDAVLYKTPQSTDDSVIVGCAKKSVTVPIALPYFFVLGSLDGTIVDKLATTKAQIKIINELRIKTFYQQSSQTQRFIYYDKEYNDAVVPALNGNLVVGVFSAIGGKLQEDAAAEVTASQGDKFEEVFDFWVYDNYIYLTGIRSSSNTVISISGCTYTATGSFDCSPKFDTPVPKGKGALLLANNDEFVSWVAEEKTFTAWAITDPKVGDGFITAVNQYKPGDKWPTDKAYQARDIQLTRRGLLIHIGLNRDNYDHAVGVISYNLGGSTPPFYLFENASGAILDGNIWLLGQTPGRLTAFRLSGPFFVAKASIFPADTANKLKITATLGETTEEATGRIYVLPNTTQQAKPEFLLAGLPYTETYANSILRTPFFYNDFYTGNNIDFSLEYDAQNPLAQYFQEKRVETTVHGKLNLFSPPITQQLGLRRAIFTEDAAVVQTKDGTVFIYTCEHTVSTDCLEKEKFSPDKIGDQTLQSDLLYYKGELVFWSKGKDGAYIITLNLQNELTFHEVKANLRTVKFLINYNTADIYISTLGMGAKEITIWKTPLGKLNTLEVIATLSKDTIGLQKFCPLKIQPDHLEPVFHILSACQTTQDQHNGIDAIIAIRIEELVFSTVVVLTQGVVVLNVEGGAFLGQPSFCAFYDHYLVADKAITDFIFSVDKDTSFARYHKRLTDYGVGSVEKLVCFPSQKQYAIYGLGGNGNGTYSGNVFAVLNAIHKSDPLKYITYLNTTEKYDFSRFDTYFTPGVIMRVQYDTPEAPAPPEYFGVLIDPPVITTKVGALQASDDGKTIEYTLKATQRDKPNGPGTEIKGTVTAVHFSSDIAFQKKKEWKPTDNGTLKLQDYTVVTGPLKSATLDTNGKDFPGLKFTDRHEQIGSMPSKLTPTIYSQFRGSVNHGVGLAFQNQVSIFNVILHQTVIGSTILTDVESFDQSKYTGPTSTIVFYSGRLNENAGYLSCWIFDEGKEHNCADIQIGLVGEKVRVVQQDQTHYMVFNLNRETGLLSCYGVTLTVDGDTITDKFELSDVISNVVDFDVTIHSKKSAVDLFAVLYSTETISHARFMKQDANSNWELTDIAFVQPDPAKKHFLTAIAAVLCKIDCDEHHVAVNTIGTDVYTFDIKINPEGPSKESITNLQKKKKLPNFDGGEIFVNHDFVAVRATSSGITKTDTKVLFWQREATNPDLYTTIDLSLLTEKHQKIEEQRGASARRMKSGKFMADKTFYVIYPITLETDQFKNSLVTTGGPRPTFPLFYYEIKPMTLFLPDKVTDEELKEIKIHFEAGRDQVVDMTVASLLNAGTPIPSNSTGSGTGSNPGNAPLNPWPFVGLMVLLVIVSIGWFSYTASKQSAAAENEFYSLEPGSRGTRGTKTADEEADELAEDEDVNPYAKVNELGGDDVEVEDVEIDDEALG